MKTKKIYNVPIERCLATKNPKLSKEWNYDKNSNLTPHDVYTNSTKKAWWLCIRCKESYYSTIHSRNKGSGCPYCSSKKVNKSNCLATKNPKLSKEWNYDKNSNLTPCDVTFSSNKKVWWLCPKCNESYFSQINDRNNGCGCPYCASKKINKSNCLATKNPKISKEWHPTKNKKLTPQKVFPNSLKKVWWLCPKCNESYFSQISNRNTGCSCPYCSGKKINKSNCLATKNPKLAKEWHPTKNKKLTPNSVTSGTNKKVWWLCPKCKSSYISTICGRNRGDNCPYCSGKKVNKSNCLATKNPKLSKEWNYDKNSNLTPCDVTFSSNKKVWWLCSKCKNSYISTIANRNNGRGCPYCSKTVTEAKCKFIIESLIDKVCESGNRAILNNNQHIDIYCEYFQLAVEYQGEQHYKFIKYWHKTKNGFNRQKDLDTQKKKRIRYLIKNKKLKYFFEIPYWESKNDHQLINFIKKELNKTNILIINKVDLDYFYNNYSGKFVSYETACQIVKYNNIKTAKIYREKYKKYPGIPSNPHRTYKFKWKGWKYFLGTL